MTRPVTRILAKLKTLILALAVCSVPSTAHAYSLDSQFARAMLKDIAYNSQGYFTNTSGDSYFMLDGFEITKSAACGLSFEMAFATSIAKPSVFEIYWQSDQQAYSELNKAFFIVPPTPADKAKSYLIDLCGLKKYSGVLGEFSSAHALTGLRLDMPVNRTLPVKFSSLRLLSKQQTQVAANKKNVEHLAAFERVATDSTQLTAWLSMAAGAGSKAGLSRISKDKPFFIFWLVILGFLVWRITKVNLAND